MAFDTFIHDVIVTSQPEVAPEHFRERSMTAKKLLWSNDDVIYYIKKSAPIFGIYRVNPYNTCIQWYYRREWSNFWGRRERNICAGNSGKDSSTRCRSGDTHAFQITIARQYPQETSTHCIQGKVKQFGPQTPLKDKFWHVLIFKLGIWIFTIFRSGQCKAYNQSHLE